MVSNYFISSHLFLGEHFLFPYLVHIREPINPYEIEKMIVIQASQENNKKRIMVNTVLGCTHIFMVARTVFIMI